MDGRDTPKGGLNLGDASLSQLSTKLDKKTAHASNN
jgi:hypothetical protein